MEVTQEQESPVQVQPIPKEEVMEPVKEEKPMQQETWSSPIIQAYKQSAEEYIWLKPATWIAALTLIMMVGTSLYMWGKSSSKNVTQADFREGIKTVFKKVPLRIEITGQLNNKASRDRVMRLEHNVELMRRDLRYLGEEQRRGQKSVNDRLDLLLKVMQSRRPAPSPQH